MPFSEDDIQFILSLNLMYSFGKITKNEYINYSIKFIVSHISNNDTITTNIILHYLRGEITETDMITHIKLCNIFAYTRINLIINCKKAIDAESTFSDKSLRFALNNFCFLVIKDMDTHFAIYIEIPPKHALFGTHYDKIGGCSTYSSLTDDGKRWAIGYLYGDQFYNCSIYKILNSLI